MSIFGFSWPRKPASGYGPSAALRPRVPLSYTPHDPGIAVVPLDEVLAPHADLLQRIHLAYGCDEKTYGRHILEVVRRYAQYVHLLPATATNFFSEHGGMLRMGLEVGFMSLQASDSVIFAGRETVTHRMHLEPRWRYATFLAGLLSEVHRVFSHLNVISGDEGDDWPAYLQPLTVWCAGNGFDRYYLRWSPRPMETRGQSLFAVPYVIDGELMQYLSDSNNAIVPHMLGCISGIPSHRESNIIDQVVRQCAAGVIDRYVAASASRYGQPIVGAHIERYLVDAMQRLVIKGTWAINGPKSRLWYGADGMYVVWPGGAVDIVKLLEKDRLPGIPKAPDSISQTLLDAQAFSSNAQGGSTFWILPPEATEPLSAVRVANPLMLLACLSDGVAPLARNLEVQAPHPPITAPAASSSSPSSLTAALRGGGRSATSSAVAPSPIPGQVDDAPDADDDGDAIGSDFVYPSRVNGDDPLSSGESASGEPSLTQSSQASSPPAPAVPRPRPVLGLLDVPRLRAAVRTALLQIVDSMNNDPPHSGRVLDAGLFVPLREFERRGLDRAESVRALHDAGIIVMQSAGSKTTQQAFDGENLLGVVIAPQCLSGYAGVPSTPATS